MDQSKLLRVDARTQKERSNEAVRRKMDKRRIRPSVSRADLRDMKEEMLAQTVNNLLAKSPFEKDLNKMESAFVLETKYMALAGKDTKIEYLETALERLYTILTNTRSHISRVKTIPANWANFMIRAYVEGGEWCSTDSILRKINLEHPCPTIWMPEHNSILQQSRLLLLKIYVERYGTQKTGRNLKYLLSHFVSGEVEEGQQLSWRGTLRHYWRYVTNASSAVPPMILRIVNFFKDGIIQIKNAISNAITGYALETFAKILMCILFFGLAGGLIYGVINTLLHSIFTGQPIDPKRIVLGEGDDDEKVDRKKGIISGVTTAISTSLDAAYNFDVDKHYTKIASVCAKFNSIEMAVNKIGAIVKPIVSYVYKTITGKPLFDADVITAQVAVHMSTLDEARKMYLANGLKFRNADDALKIAEASDELKHKLSERLHVALPSLASSVTSSLIINSDVIEAALGIVHGAKTRECPVWIHIVGKPGIGKTVFMNNLVQWLHHKYGQDYNKGTMRFDRKVGNEYWEGYTHNFAVTIDDYLQEGQVDMRRLAALEAIWAVNSNPYHLHFAGMGDKKGQYFDSPFVLTSSNFSVNQLLPDNLGIIDFKALYRRMHVKVLMQRTINFSDEDEGDLFDQTERNFSFTLIDDNARPGASLTLTQLMQTIAKVKDKHSRDFTNMAKASNEQTLASVDRAFGGHSNNALVPLACGPLELPVAPIYVGPKSNIIPVDVTRTSTTTFTSTVTTTTTPQTQLTTTIDGEGKTFRKTLNDIAQDIILTNQEMKKIGKITIYKVDHTRLVSTQQMFVSDVELEKEFLISGEGDGDEDDTEVVLTDEEDSEDEPVANRFDKLWDSCTDDDQAYKMVFDILEPDRTPQQIKDLLRNGGYNYIYFRKQLQCTEMQTYMLNCKRVSSLIIRRSPLMDLNDQRQKYFTFTGLRNFFFGQGEYRDFIQYAYDPSHPFHDPLKYLEQFNPASVPEATAQVLNFMIAVLSGKEMDPPMNTKLNKFAYYFDVRIRKMVDGSYQAFCLKNADPVTLSYFPNWKDQCFFQFAYSTTEAVWRHRDTMMQLKGEVFYTTADFPSLSTQEYYKKNKIDIIIPDEKQRKHLQMATTALTIIAALSFVTLIGLLVKVIIDMVTAFFLRDKSVIAESFDKNTEKKAKKQLNKPIPNKKNLPPRKKDPKVKEIPTVMVKRITPAGQGVEGQSASNVSLGVKFARHIEYVTLISEKDNESHCYVTFITSNQCVTASHTFRTSKIKKIIFNWCLIKGSMEYQLEEGKHYTVSFPDDRDLAIITLQSDILPRYSDLTGHLMTKEAYKDITTIASPCKATIADDGTLAVVVSGYAMRSESNVVEYQSQTIKAENMWTVPNMPHRPGECGLPIYTISDKFDKKLLGLHNGGSVIGSYFTPLFKEDFFSVSGQSLGEVTIESIYPKRFCDTMQLRDSLGIRVEGMKTEYEILKGDKPHVIWMPNTTDLRETHVFDNKLNFKNKYLLEALRLKRRPAHLKPFTRQNIDGTVSLIKPLENALAKYKGRNLPPPLTHTHDAKFFKGIFHARFNYNMIRQVTVKEAINGIKGSEFCGPIDVSTSSSVGFSDLGITSKQMFPGEPPNRTMSEDFASVYKYRKQEYYDKNLIPPFFCIGTLKDELRSEGKEDTPRLFCNGSKVSLIEARVYLMTLFEQIISHDGEGDIYIGINPHGRDWRRLAQKLESKSTRKCIADDISKWDLTMKLIFIRSFCKAAKQKGIDVNLIRKWKLILRSVLVPYIIIGNRIFRTIQMPSGSYITAIVNSMYNSWMVRVLWNVKHPDKEFDAYIAMGVFGDDLIQSISEHLADSEWNGKILATLRKKYFDQDTTSIFKDGREIPEFLPLYSFAGEESAQFLKRQFYKNLGNIFPTLSLDSVVGMVAWVRPDEKGGRPEWVCIKENMETALREAVYHGEEIFNELNEHFRNYCKVRHMPLPEINFEREMFKYLQA